jgi:adenylosuccinate lyase
VIPRYTRPEIGAVWTDEAKLERWRQVEVACAQESEGPTPAELEAIAGATFTVDAVLEREKVTDHDVAAFVDVLSADAGEAGRWIHYGLTSSDVLDTALALQLQQACEVLLGDLERFRRALRALALAHKGTLCVGRSHGIHAEPMVFGLKPALWYAEAGRNIERLKRGKEAVGVGKISGAIGTFAHVDPDVEEEVCRLLGLEPDPISTQVVQRDRHAELCAVLAVIAASLEKVAVEIRSLQRTEILEVEEPFAEGQKGSSSMPHKRNPVGSENVSGLARLVRTNALAAFENVALWHERDISHSSVERVILPDSTILVDYMLHRMTGIIEGLQVYPERMKENMEQSYGLMFSQRVLLKLADTGLPRQHAYEIVQRNAMRAWQERTSFKALLEADPEVTSRLQPADLAACFEPAWYLRNVDSIYRRAGLL